MLFLLIEGLAVEVSMADLHHRHTPESHAGIDALGWLFLAFACAIIAVAAVITYEASDTTVAKSPGSHIVSR
jgi:hypothetical protein